MLLAAAVVPVHRRVVADRADEPWRSLLIMTSAAAAIAVGDGVAVLVWGVVALSVSLGGLLGPTRSGRPDAWDAVLVASVAVWVFARATAPGESLAHAATVGLVVLAARRGVACFSDARSRSHDTTAPRPPSREVRGTVSLSGVLCDGDGLPRTTPLDLEIRAGRSVAVVRDAPEDAEGLVAALCGRRALRDGEMTVDARPVTPEDGVVTVVAPGEAFLAGSMETNLGALVEAEALSRDQTAALHEAFGLGEVETALAGRALQPDGAPLGQYHRLLLLAARVVPSSYRVLVVVDPRPWVNAVRAEVWRNAVVRASVGRTAVWVTEDPELVRSADEVWTLRHGALRPGTVPGSGGE
jgi:ABC-type transport system involved in cytochrome bd biosynthesis fused ATPase/permease subunit